MTLRIETASDGETATLRLSGRIDEDHLAELEAELRRYRQRLVFDLAEATLVDRVVVQFLAAREVEGVELRHCPRYIREWIHREVSDPKEKRMTNNDLGVWTYQDCALVLIDYQKQMFDSIRSETRPDLVELHARLLAKTATAFKMPIVLSTVGVGAGFNGPTRPSILAELPGVPVIDRTSMNAFEDRAFREAVKQTGRTRLIVGALHTEICLTFASVQALKDGYDVMYVADAVGGRSQVAHRTAIERLAHAGAVPTTALAVLTELFRDWRSPIAKQALEVIEWYFAEVPKVSKDVGVDVREKAGAAA